MRLCIVHMVRHSLNYVSWKVRKEVAADLSAIYASGTADQASAARDAFEERWGKDYPSIAQSWRRGGLPNAPQVNSQPKLAKLASGKASISIT